MQAIITPITNTPLATSRTVIPTGKYTIPRKGNSLFYPLPKIENEVYLSARRGLDKGVIFPYETVEMGSRLEGLHSALNTHISWTTIQGIMASVVTPEG